MNDVASTPTKPSRRIEEERQSRRRRDDLGDGRLRNLAIAGDLGPNYVYRWINDEPGRVHNLTQRDDWDRVTEDMISGPKSEKDRQIGSGLERIVEKASGKRAILVRKRKDYYEADKAKEQGHIDRQMDDLKRGMAPGGARGEALTPADNAYVPQGGIRIEDARRR